MRRVVCCCCCCCLPQVGVLLPLVRLLSVGGSEVQRAVALLVGQFAAPPLSEGALTAGRGELAGGGGGGCCCKLGLGRGRELHVF